MWSVNILEVEKENNRIIVEYVNGTERLTESVSMMSNTRLKNYVKGKISTFEDIDNDTPVLGAVDLSAPEVSKTPVELPAIDKVTAAAN